MRHNREETMNYKEFLASSKIAKITLALLVLDVLAAIYITTQVARYMGTAAGIAVFAVTVIVGGLIWLCHYKKPKAAAVIEVLLSILLAVGIMAIMRINSLTGEISKTTEYEIVQIVALKDSDIDKDDDFSSYIMGYTNSDDGAYEKSSDILVENDKKVKESRPYESTDTLYDELTSSHIELMVLTSNTRSDMSIIDEEYEDKIIYLCGADLSSGQDINSTGRGDVNILLTVNPNTEEVNMQVIPRDTFVYIPCRGGSSKLSYSGWWGGVQSSIDSIEDKFGVDINYYAKINFNGLIDLVDALGGVTVYSHYNYSYQGYSFVEGYNEVDGKKALRFARARKMLPQNELSRGQHQMELIKGIFKKFAENPTYENSMAVLDALENNFVTNLPEEDYYDAFKLVVKLLPELEKMENHSIEGTYKWHYDEIRDGYYQYYYYPAESEVERVRESINAILEGK